MKPNLMTNKEDYWLAHLRYWNNIPLFPRDFGLYRTQVFKDGYIFLLSTQYNKMDCYTSVYSERQIESKIFDTLFLEAREGKQSDKVNLEEVIMDRDMIRGIFDKYNIGNRCFYSGGRSYHFYVDFPPMPVTNLSAMARKFVEDLDIADLLDMKTVGNRRSMGRIPYTYNMKHKKYAIYSLTSEPEILEEEAIMGYMGESPVLELRETDILKYLNPETDTYTTELMKPAEIAFDGMYPDCVLNIMSKLRMEKHASHDERIHLAAYMYKLGSSVDDIVSAFRDASDFNPITTEQQVLSIVGKDYNPYGCGRVKTYMNGVCPYATNRGYCSYINKIMKKQQADKISTKG